MYKNASTMKLGKCGEMGFLKPEMQINILLALGVNPAARDAVKLKFTRVPSMLARYISIPLRSITKPCKTSSKCCRACHYCLFLALLTVS